MLEYSCVGRVLELSCVGGVELELTVLLPIYGMKISNVKIPYLLGTRTMFLKKVSVLTNDEILK